MKRFNTLFGLGLLLTSALTFGFIPNVAEGAVPKLINFQGILKDGSGNPVANGPYSVTFTIYNAPAGGINLWSETQSVTTTSGLFAVLLGTSNPVPDTAFKGSERWLGIAVSPDPEMAQRQQLVSVGYAYRVNTVDSASGGTITSKVSIGPGHTNTGTDAFVAGINNTASGNEAAVGGGTGNNASGYLGTIGGGYFNQASGTGAFVGGGSSNIASGLFNSSIGGGYANQASGQDAVISGGQLNIASGLRSIVGGGSLNKARGAYSVVSGGGGATASDSNSALGANSTIGGGRRNTASGTEVTVGGGSNNTASGAVAAVGGGGSNTVSGNYATVGGGFGNIASDYSATVGGGINNRGGASSATIGGGGGNSVSASYATIGGGGGNSASADYAMVGGGQENTASGLSSTIAGGSLDTAAGIYSFIGGGSFNATRSQLAAIVGGSQNEAGDRAFVGGGNQNTASGLSSAIAGGAGNLASGITSSVSGGNYNTASGFVATVGGGLNNTASGQYSTIPGGWSNVATGNYSFAAGRRAKANHLGSFVWADSSLDADFASTGANQFLIRASGGVGIGTNSPGKMLQVGDDAVVGSEGMIRLESRSSTGVANLRDWEIGVPQTGDVITGKGYSFVIDDTQLGTDPEFIVQFGSGNVGIGTSAPGFKLDVAGSAHATSFPTSSDIRLKKNVEPLSDVLEKIEKIQSVSFDWNETYEKMGRSSGHREIGVIAQDVEAVFPELVSQWGDEHYRGVDYGRMTAVLIEAVKEQQKQIAELKEEILKLKKETHQAQVEN